MAQILMLKRNYNPRQSRECSCDVRSDDFSFLLPDFESGFQCSHNSSPPVIWIVSLYLWDQVYFIIIIVEFFVTVLSITYLRNIFWGWTVPLSVASMCVRLNEVCNTTAFLKPNILLLIFKISLDLSTVYTSI